MRKKKIPPSGMLLILLSEEHFDEKVQMNSPSSYGVGENAGEMEESEEEG